MPLFTVILRGETVQVGSPLSSVTIPGVRVDSGESLFLLFTSKASGFFAHALNNNKWGSTNPTSAGQSSAFGPSSTGQTYLVFWGGPTPGAADITITFTEATKPTDVVAAAYTVRKTNSGNIQQQPSPLFLPPTGSTAPLDTTSVDEATALAFMVLGHGLLGDVADAAGTWEPQSNASATRRLGRNGNANVILDVAFQEIPFNLTPHVVKTGFTDREWGIAAGVYNGVASLGGKSSYDISRFNEGSPEAQVLPEVESRVRAGDRRFMRQE